MSVEDVTLWNFCKMVSVVYVMFVQINACVGCTQRDIKTYYVCNWHINFTWKRPDKAFLGVQVWIKLQEELWIRIYQTNTDSCICAMKTLGSLSLLGQYIFIPVIDGSILGIQSYNKQVMYKYPYSSCVIFQSMYKWFQF